MYRKGAMVDKYIPLVIHKCVKALDGTIQTQRYRTEKFITLRSGKLRTEGLFRLSGSAAATEKIRIEIDDGTQRERERQTER
jgi:hypothetical protein